MDDEQKEKALHELEDWKPDSSFLTFLVSIVMKFYDGDEQNSYKAIETAGQLLVIISLMTCVPGRELQLADTLSQLIKSQITRAAEDRLGLDELRSAVITEYSKPVGTC
jgi:hypothetical protein